MGHIGMLPQSIKGKPTVFGKKRRKKQIADDLKFIEKAGVFAVVVECTLESVVSSLMNKKMSQLLELVLKKCDGQTL